MKMMTIGMGVFAMLLAGAATGQAQGLTDAQRDRMREWRDAREDPRQGTETPAEIRRRERREQMGGGDAREIQEFRDAREEHGGDDQRGPSRQPTRQPAALPDPAPFQPQQQDPRAEQQRREQERQQVELAARRAVLETVMASLQEIWPQMIQRFDRDGSGYLNDQELAALLQTLQAHLHRFPAQAGN